MPPKGSKSPPLAPVPPPRADPYAHPLYYDIINSPGTADEVTTLEQIGRRFMRERAGKRPRRAWSLRDAVWLEPACGTGRYLRVLARRGGACVGVDLDRGMAEFAAADLKTRGLERRACVIVGDMRKMDGAPVRRAVREVQAGSRGKVTRPVIAFCFHNSVRHLLSDKDMVAHLRSMGKVIGPDGLYLVGLGLIGPGGEVACETVARAQRRGTTVREVIDFVPPEADVASASNGPDSRTEHAYRHLAVSTPKEELEFVSHYQLRTYTLEQWWGVVKRAGLEEIAVVGAWGKPLPADRRTYAVRVLRVAR